MKKAQSTVDRKKRPSAATKSGRTTSPKPEKATPSAARFPVVGLGASAGGLEALESFFQNVVVPSGMAYVVVQHLDPIRKGILAELLQNQTSMKVVQAKDGTTLRPDCVYVIPPNRDMILKEGKLHLTLPLAPRGLRLPIDLFFRSLASELGDRGVGVILSGMGTDGTAGLKRIKEQAGLVLVQDPTSARFDPMPRSAIAAGVADIVCKVASMPQKIQARYRSGPNRNSDAGKGEPMGAGMLEQVLALIRNQAGHDFSLYKKNTLYRRIERRVSVHKLNSGSAYVEYLRENPQEIDLLFKEMLIGVTSFFRDPQEWARLAKEVLEPIFSSALSDQVVRAWVPACSTGEEAYSLAIVFREALEQAKPRARISLQIFATDLDPATIEKARQGVFPNSIAADVSPERLSRFFVKEERSFRISKDIREQIIFARHNIINDPPFTKLDILSCRNLLIYFNSDLQRKLLKMFHYTLRPGGTLFLGSAESVAGFGELFTAVSGRSRIFRRENSHKLPALVDFPSSNRVGSPDVQPLAVPPAQSQDNLQALASKWLLQKNAPAAVLVNEQGHVLFINGKTGRYLEPAAGKANWNIFAMVRDELRFELTAAFQKAHDQEEPVLTNCITVTSVEKPYFVTMVVESLPDQDEARGLVMIVFHEVPDPSLREERRKRSASASGGRVDKLQADLRRTQEAMQISKEELRSMNEEMQSTNEELQSANEELTTSKEEMQSLNEELQTVNAELQAKVDELSAASNDMKNLLNSTEIATVFLDGNLHVRRFTEQATQIIKLIPGDIGRPVTDLANNLLYPGLVDDAREVLRTLVPVEKALNSRDGRLFAMRVIPYRTMDNRIDGVVITFVDMSVLRKVEERIRANDEIPVRPPIQ